MIQTSIRNKLNVLLLLITIILLGVILTTYFYTRESLENNYIQENEKLLYQGRENVEGYMDELIDITLSFYSNRNFMNYLKSDRHETDFETFWTVRNELENFLYTDQNLKKVNISLFDENKSIAVSKSKVMFTQIDDATTATYFDKVKHNPHHMYIEKLSSEQRGNDDNVISIHRAIIDVPSNDLLAFISVEIEVERLFEISEQLYSEDTEDFYIFTSEGEALYHSKEEVENQDWIDRILSAEKEQGTLNWDTEDLEGIIFYSKLPESSGGLILVKNISYSSLYQSALSIVKKNILIGVVGLLLTIIAIFYVSFKITSPIHILVENIQNINKEKMEVNFKSLGNDEIGVLGEYFKQMIQRINHLINREYKLEIKNKTNQLKVLQAQINPHFLYNALQSIGTVALKKKVPQVYTLITHLSKIMRYGMDMDKDKVQLIEEINYCKAFLLLQKERFGKRFDYSVNVEADTMSDYVPKMLLQPIIENYFKHGFDGSDRKIGQLSITGYHENHDLVIEIGDNGKGISTERLQEIRRYLNEEQKKSETDLNIGLKNIHSRLHLYYDGQASLRFRNKKTDGLLVTIRIPIETEDDIDESNHY
ncbi:sensor histidine kinase [Aquibacillus albus]|uniref:Two-component system sensor histidine kinase YesM n=1 Tax=Aquibacillus albus TaxID=1168171 RepID=A0ABS2MWA2_9BACI|nr:sensor histidine kinase [Aquibacillus albus]MBM7570167.1 two-component system sensor histidine kinase YesM [Aquibacillus albus]